MNPRPIRLEARAIADADGTLASPGTLLLRFDNPRIPHAATLLAAGTPDAVARHPAAASAPLASFPSSILIPGLVNAHTHLDLTHIGPQPFDPETAAARGGFVDWVDMIRARRAVTDADVAASVRRGIALALAGGTVAVGDIGGAMPPGRATLTPWRTLRDSPLLGVSYLEFFAIGRTIDSRTAIVAALLDEAADELDDPQFKGVRLGLQPHAPNTVGPRAFRWAAETALRCGLPLSTHLAETIEERRFIGRAEGPQRELLERVGVWDDDLLAEFGRGLHPVAHMADTLAAAPFLVAHVNDADDAAIETLARTGTRVAYCPRASTYFGAAAHFGPHRYRDMLAAGIPVALGTDSVVNLEPWCRPGPLASLGVLDEMRLLSERDGTPAATLLRMATVNGASALGLDPRGFRFGMSDSSNPAVGRPLAGVVRVELGDLGMKPGEDPLEHLMRGDGSPSLLSHKIFSDFAG